MLSYFAFVHSGLESAGNPLIDGGTIAQRCLEKLAEVDEDTQLPPRLLVLLASPAYLDPLKSEQLLNGVLDGFDAQGHSEIPLIGCSVAAVFFNQHIYRQGCLLVCLASRLLQAKVAAVRNASQHPQESAKALLKQLNLIDRHDERVHSFVERSLMALFPGFGANKYLAPSLHESLREQLEARISIFGGVASANDPERLRSGLLFANRKVYRDAIVAASLEHGTPFGLSLSQGLTDTNKTVNVARLDPDDPRIILQFREGGVNEVMSNLLRSSPVPLFGDLSMDRDTVVDVPVLKGETVQLTREAHERESFHLLEAEPNKIRTALTAGVKQSMQRAFLLNPIGALGLRCTGLLRNEKKVGLELEQDLRFVERDLALRDSPFEKSYIGGFVDGEAGVDSYGKSVLSNWANATMVFGDELRFRTPVYRGFEKLTEFAGMAVADNQDEGIERLTKLVYDIGFPGAMLSLCLFEQDRRAIVPHSASGPRYERLRKRKEPYFINIDDTNQNDVLAIVARSKRPQVVLDCRQEISASMKAASGEGIISQYLVPLLNYDQQVTAILQIDLGDISYSPDLFDTERTALDSLGNIVGAALNRIFVWEESKITNRLDQAMNELPTEGSVQQALQHYFERVIEAFGLKGDVGGHIRLHQKEHRLRLIAGVGSYYETARDSRRDIDTDDPSPTGQAFRSEHAIIINSPATNDAHLEMCREWEKKKPALVRELRKVGSYVNIPFRSERDEQGTISITAGKPWFFTDLHKKLLKILSHRTAFLLETLRRKEQETFLLAVSPSFYRVQNLENISTILKDELENFARAINAEIASLYIWDEDRQRYILRAQYGWAKPDWLHAAYYESHDFWAGTTALTGTPRHIPDLNSYYDTYIQSTRRHTKDAFGEELSAAANVEAIALGLRIGASRFGVVTFYRRLSADARADDDSGFLLTNAELLQQGADNFASLISILETARHEKWRRGEVSRRQDVHNVTVSVKVLHPERSESAFEDRVCEQLLRSYHAVRVGFYKKVELANNKVESVVRMERDAQTHEVRKLPRTTDEQEMRLVNEVMLANLRGERRLLIERVKVRPEERDPHKVALAHLVSRACIPLLSEKQVIGVLDLHWSFDHMRKADTANYQHGGGFLLMLGEMVGEAYAREEAKLINKEIRDRARQKLNRGTTRLLESTEQTRNAVQATTAYVLQHHHELRHIVTKMRSSLRSLKVLRKEAGETERELLDRLSERIKEGTATLKRMIEIGRKMSTPVFERHMLEGLIFLSLKSQLRRYPRTRFDVSPLQMPDEQVVFVDAKLMGIVFDNLLHNALKFMMKSNPRRLRISAVHVPDYREIEITIEDSGIGMSEEKIRRVLTQFYSINNRISVGVTIARLILALHGGRLNYDSDENDGTRTIIVLPLD